MHGLNYDLRGNQRSDQKITDQLIMLLLCLTSLPFGVDNDRKRISYQKYSYWTNISFVICKIQKNTRINCLMSGTSLGFSQDGCQDHWNSRILKIFS